MDLWFDLASNYSYLTLMRIDALAERAGVSVRWEPFLLGPVFEAFGWKSSPFVLQKEKGAYVWKDMERQAAKYGLPWKKPARFPQNTVLPIRVALSGRDEPWVRPFCRALSRANFAEDRDISTAEAVREVLASLGLPADEHPRPRAIGGGEAAAPGAGAAGAGAGHLRGAHVFRRRADVLGNDRLEDALEAAQRTVGKALSRGPATARREGTCDRWTSAQCAFRTACAAPNAPATCGAARQGAHWRRSSSTSDSWRRPRRARSRRVSRRGARLGSQRACVSRSIRRCCRPLARQGRRPVVVISPSGRVVRNQSGPPRLECFADRVSLSPWRPRRTESPPPPGAAGATAAPPGAHITAATRHAASPMTAVTPRLRTP